MNKEYIGGFVRSWASLMLAGSFNGITGLLRGDKLSISPEKLIITMKGKQIELPKSQVKHIHYYWYLQLLTSIIRIDHDNPQLPKFLAFCPFQPFGFKKTLVSAGYNY